MIEARAVTTFSTGSGSINSSADFSAVNGLPGNVKVVQQINWCGTIGAGRMAEPTAIIEAVVEALKARPPKTAAP